jgi:hypothetical protein
MKNFLISNKIYVEVFSYFFLGIMALVVSITQVAISKSELEIHKNELLPIFRVDYNYLKPDTIEYYDTQVLTISNEGKPIKSFKYDINTYYRFEISTRNSQTEILIPVQGFYFARFNTNNSTGKLLEAFGKGNNKIYHQLYLDCMSLTKNDTYVFIDLVSVFKLSYIDINNKKCITYLDNGGHDISEWDYLQITQEKTRKFKDSLYHYYEIDSNFIKTNLLDYKNDI